MSGRLLNTAEAAKRLGFTPGTILDWHERGYLDIGRKIGGRLRFPEDELDAWVDGQRVWAGTGEAVSPNPSKRPPAEYRKSVTQSQSKEKRDAR